ncbi:DUF4870 domain-containing protein [Methanobrevibacter sp.]|uniref:DUF4870 domain-containing protein n=1 Tax=Methanobrevibacter sp. TaxID=66852 RepID=UPI00388ECDE3
MDTAKILVIIGYILAILIPLIGIIYGLILYFVKGDDEYIKKHAKYIIIVGVIIWAFSLILMVVFDISAVGLHVLGAP